MKWDYTQPVAVHFETGAVKNLAAVIASCGYGRGVLVSDPFFVKSGLAGKVVGYSGGALRAVYSQITPNPRVDEADACAGLMRSTGADFAVSLGGGSSLDCAKAACALAVSGGSARDYHSGGKKFTRRGLPLIAVPTTAGTGSEVTCVAVLSDPEKGIKGPIANPLLFPAMALIDPELTLSVPPKVTASTGLDVLSHAIEGFWSKGHQPVCDALALHAARLAFANIRRAYDDGGDLDAREKMCEASVTAGLAFTLPKTAASHACSFPLTAVYGLPHGEACAFTLDVLCAINAPAEGGRLNDFAKELGFGGAEDMGREITRIKRYTGMRCTLKEAGISEQDLPELAKKCHHPNMLNNPVELDDRDIIDMFLATNKL
jgi:alcohol dehydrogenase class IV